MRFRLKKEPTGPTAPWVDIRVRRIGKAPTRRTWQRRYAGDQPPEEGELTRHVSWNIERGTFVPLLPYETIC